MKSYSVCFSLYDLFHLTQYPQGPSMMQMAIIHLFKWLSSILMNIYIYIHISHLYFLKRFAVFSLLTFPFKNNFIYLFILGCAGSSLLHGFFSRYCKRRLLSSCSACRLFVAVASLVVEHGHMQASVGVAPGLPRTGSTVVAQGPSCSAACRIFPDQGSNPCLLHWQEPPGKLLTFWKIFKLELLNRV